MQLPIEFLPLESLATLSGATLLVWIASNTLRLHFGLDPRYSAGLLSALVQVFVWAAKKGGWEDLVLALLNAFLIYFYATGANEILASRPKVPAALDDARDVSPRRSFFEKWW